MNYLIWLVRAKRWAKRPPSGRQVVLVLGVLAVCLAIAGIERFIGWPEWMTLDPRGMKP